MEKKRRLGRGLDEVADLWLSSSSLSTNQSEEPEEKDSSDASQQVSSTKLTSKAISIFYPESTKVKGVLVTNLALELSKLGFGSCILDYGSNGSPLRSMMGNLFQGTLESDTQEAEPDIHQVIRLYGMSTIHLFSLIGKEDIEIPKMPFSHDHLFSQILKNNLQDSIIFLYHQDKIEDIVLLKELPSVVILVSRPRKESLLISYAYIKMILKKNPNTRILIIMDEVIDRDEAVKAFTFLSQIVSRRLSDLYTPLQFLGSVVHDQAFGISMATSFPLVLSEEKSASKESISRIAANLLRFFESPE